MNAIMRESAANAITYNWLYIALITKFLCLSTLLSFFLSLSFQYVLIRRKILSVLIAWFIVFLCSCIVSSINWKYRSAKLHLCNRWYTFLFFEIFIKSHKFCITILSLCITQFEWIGPDLTIHSSEIEFWWIASCVQSYFHLMGFPSFHRMLQMKISWFLLGINAYSTVIKEKLLV